MCCAADMLAFPSRKQVVLVGVKSSEEFENMVTAAHAAYDPNKTVSTSFAGIYKPFISHCTTVDFAYDSY